MQTVKKVLFYLFGISVFGIINPAIWIFLGCVTPVAGILLNNHALSKPVNPVSLFFWGGAIISIIYNVYYSIKEVKEANKNKPGKKN